MTLGKPPHYSYFILVTTLITTSVVYSSNVRVSPKIEILEVDPNHPSTVGVVGGMQQCGGSGQVVEIRYGACSGEVICKLPKDGQIRRAEMEFVPSQDIPALGVRFNFITEDGQETTYERPISNSTVRSGQAYTCIVDGAASPDIPGEQFSVQWMLYQVENNDIEVCGEIHYILFEPNKE